MSDLFDLPQEFVNEVAGAMSGEKIELPFVAPYFWWQNGKPAYKALGSAAYFGGWASDADTYEGILHNNGLEIPGNTKRITLANNEGKEYDVFACRSMPVAVIAKRSRWMIDETTGKGRGHTQILAYAATGKKTEAGTAYVAWSPVVISGKGLAAKAIEDALRDFDRNTAAARRQYAKNLPAWFFWCNIGTFGDKPEQKMVGSGQQSPITPATVYLPKDGVITAEMLKTWYVGGDVAAVMVDLKKQAKEWLEAWRENKSTGPAVDVPPPPDSDYPF